VYLTTDMTTRYTDFIVNEIALDGTVVHLTTDKAPNFRPAAKVRTLESFLLFD
jgi:hypothetical protein